jgi:hypothetical protein
MPVVFKRPFASVYPVPRQSVHAERAGGFGGKYNHAPTPFVLILIFLLLPNAMCSLLCLMLV